MNNISWFLLTALQLWSSVCPHGISPCEHKIPSAWCAQYSKQTDDRYGLGRGAKVISVEIRLISVIYIRCTVVSGYCVCVYRRYVVCVCVCGGGPHWRKQTHWWSLVISWDGILRSADSPYLTDWFSTRRIMIPCCSEWSNTAHGTHPVMMPCAKIIN